MGKIHIINPAAGQGIGSKITGKIKSGDEYYFTKHKGDAIDFISKKCREIEYPHFVIYGGDGSVNEAVNGIMLGGAPEKAALSIVPLGTGNDFVRWFDKCGKDEAVVDVIKINDRYSVNMINIGFDCDVVIKTEEMKHVPLISGSIAYAAGIAAVLAKPMGKPFLYELTLEDGSVRRVESELLLTAVANAPYCGGGFYSAPKADPCDGIIDIVLVNKISKPKFLSLVSYYKKGNYLDDIKDQHGQYITKEKIRGIIEYIRCKSMKLTLPRTFCLDGIVFTEEGDCDIEISVIPRTLKIVRLAEAENEQ